MEVVLQAISQLAVVVAKDGLQAVQGRQNAFCGLGITEKPEGIRALLGLGGAIGRANAGPSLFTNEINARVDAVQIYLRRAQLLAGGAYRRCSPIVTDISLKICRYFRYFY